MAYSGCLSPLRPSPCRPALVRGCRRALLVPSPASSCPSAPSLGRFGGLTFRSCSREAWMRAGRHRRLPPPVSGLATAPVGWRAPGAAALFQSPRKDVAASSLRRSPTPAATTRSPEEWQLAHRLRARSRSGGCVLEGCVRSKARLGSVWMVTLALWSGTLWTSPTFWWWLELRPARGCRSLLRPTWRAILVWSTFLVVLTVYSALTGLPRGARLCCGCLVM